MSFNLLLTKWCALTNDENIVIITDTDRIELAKYIQSELNNCEIICIDENKNYFNRLLDLSSSDLVIALFSMNAFMNKKANKIFSPFCKPNGIKAKYVFIRLDISKQSLLEGLSTPTEIIFNKINELHKFPKETKLHITNKAGTDITLKINPFTTCSHIITSNGDMAFLPPSETSSEVISNTANGKIVVDVTVGQLYKYTNFLGYFGLIDEPVTLIVENGIITDILGDKMAIELKEKLFTLEEECRILVEIGHGLSKMKPTGLIGVDESIIDTCHFGIGDGFVCGVHLDVVISNPTIIEI